MCEIRTKECVMSQYNLRTRGSLPTTHIWNGIKRTKKRSVKLVRSSVNSRGFFLKLLAGGCELRSVKTSKRWNELILLSNGKELLWLANSRRCQSQQQDGLVSVPACSPVQHNRVAQTATTRPGLFICFTSTEVP
jgi:hypothetical protein